MTDDIRLQIVALLPRLRRFAYSLTGSYDEADDVVQSACERALKRLHQFQRGTKLDSWMFSIVHSVMIDGVRRRKVRAAIAIDDSSMQIAGDDDVGMQVLARADLEIVRREMMSMPDEQRVLIAMVAIDGMSYQQAADALGVPIGTVMSRLSRARKRLADVVDGSRAPGAPRAPGSTK